MKNVFWMLLTLLAGVGMPLRAQDQFEAIPRGRQPEYRLDFQKNFFRNPGDERADRLVLLHMYARLENLKGRVSGSSGDLLKALQLYDSVVTRYSLHDALLYLRHAVNTRDEVSLNDESALGAEFTKRTQFLQQELMSISADGFGRLARGEPRLEAYRFEVESAGRLRDHTLPLAEEERLATLSPAVTDWQYELYQSIIRRTNFTIVRTPEGTELNVWTQRGAIANHPDRSVREKGFKARFSDFARQRDVYAFVLLHLIKARNALSQAHHYKNFPDESYSARFLDVAGVKNLLETVGQHASIVITFEKIRAEHLKRTKGYATINSWDLAGGAAASAVPRFDIDRARVEILAALRPLGAEHDSEMSQLLDPAQGRLDIVGGENRQSGGGGVGFPGIPNVFYSHGYEGYYKDVSVLAHEAGHVVHYQMMGNNHSVPVYAWGPNYFSESFAILNELLLADHLCEREHDPALKAFYLEQFLEVKGLEVFRGAQDAELEQRIYDGVEADTVKNADGLDALTQQVLTRYTVWGEVHPELRGSWMLSRLMYEDPLYLVNYLYAGILSLKYYELYQKNPAEFSKGYCALMRNGFNDTPARLLKRFLGIDFGNPALLADGMRLLENKVSQLQEHYNRMETLPQSR